MLLPALLPSQLERTRLISVGMEAQETANPLQVRGEPFNEVRLKGAKRSGRLSEYYRRMLLSIPFASVIWT